MENEKAKYIVKKEEILHKKLQESYKNLGTISNWYSQSNYKFNEEDQKSIKEYILEVNNIYHGLKSLLINTTNNYDLYSNLKELITEGDFVDIEDIDKMIVELKENKI